MSDPIDPTPYIVMPIVDVPTAVGLCCRLLAAIPKPPTKGVRAAAKQLRAETVALQKAWGASDDANNQASDKRPADLRVDNAWGALFKRVDAYGELPDAEYPKAPRAREIVGTLFPDGLGFLTLPYPAEWAESEKRLARIDEKELVADINALAGPEFLAELRKAHLLYGQALGMTAKRPAAPAVNLADPLRAVRAAIPVYTLALCAMSNEDPATRPAVREALAPLDELRAAATARKAPPTPAPAPTPTTPVPEVPDATKT